MWTAELLALSARVGHGLQTRGWLLVTAESCTGGGLSALITEVAGSSQWFDRGFVTYSNQAKQEVLKVKDSTLNQRGAVSEAVVLEMAQGALEQSRAQVAVAISGIAGPGGGTPEKPVGTLCIAWAAKSLGARAHTFQLTGSRAEIRQAALQQALLGLMEMVA
jgi:nicotinamide-nucleotide amidase